MNTKRKAIPTATRKFVHQKYGGRCAYCGQLIAYNEMQVDHLHPVKKGGTDKTGNLMPACRSCNHYKESFTLEQFRDRLSNTLDNFKQSPLARLAHRYEVVPFFDTWNKRFYFEKHP